MRLPIILASVALAGCQTTADLPQACEIVADPWQAARSLAAAGSQDAKGNAAFAPNEAVRFTLLPQARVAYAAPRQNDAEQGSFGGVAGLEVRQAGRYSVNVSDRAWVDVVVDGKPAVTVTHGKAAPCSGIRKFVQFDLEPGVHALEISNSAQADVGILVTPAR